MRSIETEIVIEAPASVVWQHLTRLENYEKWNPFITQASGRAEVGQKLAITISFEGKNNWFAPVVQEADPVKRFVWRDSLPLGLFVGEHRFELISVGAGTTRLRHSEQFSGWLSGIILGLIQEPTRKGFEAMNEALKKRCEAGNRP